MKPRHPGMGDMGMPLGLVRLLPTPRTSDTSGTGAHGDGGPDLRTAVALLPAHAQPPSSEGATSSWGPYAAAVERWEALTRPAPQPVDERDRLNPAFVEWLMGLAEHHVTGVDGLSRAAQLKALGNGVVPQQAAAALRLLLDRFDQPHAVSCGHWAGCHPPLPPRHRWRAPLPHRLSVPRPHSRRPRRTARSPRITNTA